MVGQCIAMGNYIFGWKLPCPHPDTAPPPPPPPPAAAIAECDIRENFDTNECPNIFVSTKLHE